MKKFAIILFICSITISTAYGSDTTNKIMPSSPEKHAPSRKFFFKNKIQAPPQTEKKETNKNLYGNDNNVYSNSRNLYGNPIPSPKIK